MIATASRQQLRDYQERAVETVIEKLDSRPILVSPTGSGKTTMATEIVERLGLPTLWLAHRKELIDQAAKRLAAHGLDVGIVMAGYKSNPAAQVQVASVQTLVRRDSRRQGWWWWTSAITPRRNLPENSDDYGDAALIGLTATPFPGRPGLATVRRTGGRGLAGQLCAAGVLQTRLGIEALTCEAFVSSPATTSALWPSGPIRRNSTRTS